MICPYRRVHGGPVLGLMYRTIHKSHTSASVESDHHPTPSPSPYTQSKAESHLSMPLVPLVYAFDPIYKLLRHFSSSHKCYMPHAARHKVLPQL